MVAEGIETEEEQKKIFESGVQYMQGFYYARLMQEEKLIHFFKEKCELKNGRIYCIMKPSGRCLYEE